MYESEWCTCLQDEAAWYIQIAAAIHTCKHSMLHITSRGGAKRALLAIFLRFWHGVEP